MKILLVAELSYGALGESYFNALRKVGHEVFKFDFIYELRNIASLSSNRLFFRLFKKMKTRERKSVSMDIKKFNHIPMLKEQKLYWMFVKDLRFKNEL